MIEHWYDYLPAVWFMPEGRWYVILNLFLLMAMAFTLGFYAGKKFAHKKK